MPNMIMRRAGLALLTGTTLAGSAVACGAPAAPPAAPAPPAASQAQHNGQDVMFAQ